MLFSVIFITWNSKDLLSFNITFNENNNKIYKAIFHTFNTNYHYHYYNYF